MKLSKIKQVVNHNLCIGCGLCTIDDSVEMKVFNGMFRPDHITDSAIIEASCPSKGYNLKAEGKDLFGEVLYRSEIGYYRNIYMAHTNRESLLKNASSGGIMTEVALNLLSHKLIDGVITTKFILIENKVRTETYIATSENELILGQGSKYCPTSTLSIIKQLNPQKKYLLIGTPCQIAALRLYSKQEKKIKDMIPYTIANFCGGFRDFREVDFFVNDVAHVKNVSSFRHRGGGQPGSMRIEGASGELFQYPYPDYARLSNFIKNERCTLCMDATGELADISCGDAWLEKKDHNHPWSIVVARSEFGSRIIETLRKEGKISLGNELNITDVIKAQKLNITSKKYRQYKRIKIRDILLRYSPNWYEYPIKGGTYTQEIRILLAKQKEKMKKTLLSRFK